MGDKTNMEPTAVIVYVVAQLLASVGGMLIGLKIDNGKGRTFALGIILTSLGIGIAVAQVAAVIVKGMSA